MSGSAGWSQTNLGTVVGGIRAGFSANGDERPRKRGERGVLKTGAVLGGRFDPTQQKVVVEQADQLRVPVTGKTIILGRKNSAEMVGASVFVEHDHPGLFLSDLLWEITPAEGVDTLWLAFALQHDSIRERIRLSATGTQSTMKNLSRDVFLSVPVLVPPLPEQRRIAEILRTWDDAIDRTARVRAAKLEIARATLNHMVDSSVDPSVFSLGEIFRERVEVGGVGAPLLSVTQSNGVIRHAESGRKDSSSADRSKYKRVLSGDIAYNTMRMWQGASGLVEEEGIVSPAYTVVVADPSRISPQFAAHVLKSERVKFEFERYSQGITSDTWNLKFPAFSRVTVSIPSLAEQERFNSLLREMHAELTLLDRNLELLRTQKRGLMQKLLTGEVRVQLNAKQKDSADV